MRRSPILVTNRDRSDKSTTGSLEHLTLNLTANKKLIRKDSMEGRDYTVVPMVMMKEGVLNGSLGPLFYPADEISKLPIIWNHKPVVVYHPQINGSGVSACSPDVLTAQKIGVIMNTHYDEASKTLKAEAWIEESRCKKVDKRVWNAIEKESMMELSTGLFTENEPVENGKHGDKPYSYIARNYKPDHLAVLPDQVGACSVKDGAGFVRNELWAENRMVNNSVSFDDIRSQLGNLIRAKYQRKNAAGIENYCYPESVYDDYVVFSCGDGKTMGQSYNVSKSGEVSLSGSPVEVRRKTIYVGSDGKTVVGNAQNYSRKEKVAILINSGVFLKRDRDWLLGLASNRLNTLFMTATMNGTSEGVRKAWLTRKRKGGMASKQSYTKLRGGQKIYYPKGYMKAARGADDKDETIGPKPATKGSSSMRAPKLGKIYKKKKRFHMKGTKESHVSKSAMKHMKDNPNEYIW